MPAAAWAGDSLKSHGPITGEELARLIPVTVAGMDAAIAPAKQAFET